jgi:hypothetical protein
MKAVNFPQNVGKLLPDYTGLYSRRFHSHRNENLRSLKANYIFNIAKGVTGTCIKMECDSAFLFTLDRTGDTCRSQWPRGLPCSNTGNVGSNPIRGMDVCVGLVCVCVVLCVGTDLATGWSPVKGDLPTVYRIKKLNWKSGQGSTKGL